MRHFLIFFHFYLQRQNDTSNLDFELFVWRVEKRVLFFRDRRRHAFRAKSTRQFLRGLCNSRILPPEGSVDFLEALERAEKETERIQ